jgi:hypothetical protein
MDIILTKGTKFPFTNIPITWFYDLKPCHNANEQLQGLFSFIVIIFTPHKLHALGLATGLGRIDVSMKCLNRPRIPYLLHRDPN